MCPSCGTWHTADWSLHRLRWTPVTDEAWLASPEVLAATIAVLDDIDAVPWFDPTHEWWWRWNVRFAALSPAEQTSILGAAEAPLGLPYEIRTARTADGQMVRYTCGRDPNLALIDPVGIAEWVFNTIDQLEDPPVGAPIVGFGDAGITWALAPLDPRYEALACRSTLTVVLRDPEGRWPWDLPSLPVLTEWRPE